MSLENCLDLIHETRNYMEHMKYNPVGFNFIGSSKDLPVNGSIGDVCLVDNTVYLYSNSSWEALEHIYEENSDDSATKMRYYKLTCDGCGASIEIKDKNNITCQYCGSKYYSKHYIEDME